MQVIERRKRGNYGKTYVKSHKKLPINFDINSLDLMCQYVVSNNRNIKRGMYINLRNLIELLDLTKYNDEEKYKRIMFIKKGLDGKLEQGISTKSLLIQYIKGGFISDNEINFPFISEEELSSQEIEWINSTVSNTLSYIFLYDEIDTGIDLFTRFKTASSNEISNVGNQIIDYIAKLNSAIRKHQSMSNNTQMFDLTDKNLYTMIDSTRVELTDVNRKLYTGMIGFNQLIGGGFENTRCYLFLGITGVGKSLSLLNIAYQLKKMNKHFISKDPTKIPTIVYFTQENTVTETIDRLFTIATGNNIRNVSTEEAIQLLRTKGELLITDESPINLLVVYKPNRSVDTSYLYTLTEDLEDDGYEVICMIQDHVKRIRSINNYGSNDIRLELGEVINEMKTFAILKEIPVITISHLNREAARVIDNASSKTNQDIIKQLGKSNVGESMLMLDNIDYAGIIHVEYDQNEQKYMSFKTIKKRIGCMRDCIYQPFDEQNQIKLIEDHNTVPRFKESLYEDMMIQQQSNRYGNIVNINDINKNRNTETSNKIESNLFEFASKYSSIQNMPISYSEIEKQKEYNKRLFTVV